MPELRTDWLTESHGPSWPRIAAAATERVPAGRQPDACGSRFARRSRRAELPVLSRATNHRTPPAVYEQLDAGRPLAGPRRAEQVSGRRRSSRRRRARPLKRADRRRVGAHEVIIESPRHVDRTVGAFGRRAARRARSLCRSGFAIGATTAGLPTAWCSRTRARGPARRSRMCTVNSSRCPPCRRPSTAELRRAAQSLREATSRVLIAGSIEQERAAGERIVLDRDGFVAFCPFASLQPYEVWLLPAEHEPSFERCRTSDAFDRLAGVLHDADRSGRSDCPRRGLQHAAADRALERRRRRLVPLADRAAARHERHCRTRTGHRHPYQSAPAQNAPPGKLRSDLAFFCMPT